MGCSSSKIGESNKINSNNIKSTIGRDNKYSITALNNSNNDNNLKSRNVIQINKIVLDKLENQDIIDKLMLKPLPAAYFKKIFALKKITEEMEFEFSGLFDMIKSEYEEISKRFGIKFFIPDSNFEIDLKSFKLECLPCNQVDIDLYIPLFIMEILLYPNSFIKKLKLKQFVFINSLNFCTLEYQQYRAACPEYYKTMSLYYCAKERYSNYIRTVIHHELFHYVDFIHDGTYYDSKFSKFNLPGFKYGRGGAYEREWKPLNPETKGFLNFYSTTGIEEDKAEIYQFLMVSPTRAFKHEDEIINKKVFYIANFLKEFDQEGMGNKDNDYFAALTKHRITFDY